MHPEKHYLLRRKNEPNVAEYRLQNVKLRQYLKEEMLRMQANQ